MLQLRPGSAVGPLLGYKEGLNLVGKGAAPVGGGDTQHAAARAPDRRHALPPVRRPPVGMLHPLDGNALDLAAVPAKAGARSLRPAFAAGDQTVYDVDASFDFSRLPSYENITKAISQWPDDGKSIAPLTYQQIVDRYRMPFYDLCASNWSTGVGCGSGGAYEAFVPQLSAAMARNGSSIGGADTYGASIGRDIQEAILYVMNDAEMARTPQKAAAVYALLQRGIDYFGQKQSSPLAPVARGGGAERRPQVPAALLCGARHRRRDQRDGARVHAVRLPGDGRHRQPECGWSRPLGRPVARADLRVRGPLLERRHLPLVLQRR